MRPLEAAPHPSTAKLAFAVSLDRVAGARRVWQAVSQPGEPGRSPYVRAGLPAVSRPGRGAGPLRRAPLHVAGDPLPPGAPRRVRGRGQLGAAPGGVPLRALSGSRLVSVPVPPAAAHRGAVRVLHASSPGARSFDRDRAAGPFVASPATAAEERGAAGPGAGSFAIEGSLRGVHDGVSERWRGVTQAVQDEPYVARLLRGVLSTRTQAALARTLGVHRNTVRGWVRGEYLPSLKHLDHLERLLRDV